MYLNINGIDIPFIVLVVLLVKLVLVAILIMIMLFGMYNMFTLEYKRYKMKNVMQAIFFAFREILTWHTMKYALIIGSVITTLWVGVGMFFWDSIIQLSSNILSWIPFSMIRSNGAWMLSTFLWLQLILFTFALVFAFFGNVILRIVSQEKYSSFSVWVAVGSTLFWSIIWFFKGDAIYQQFLKLLTRLPFETIEKGIAFLIGFYLIYNAIVVTMVFMASLFSEPLIASVEKRHFKEDDMVRDNIFSSVRYTIKDSMIFLGVSILAFPLLFIPVINIFTQIVLWTWLIKDTVGYDALSLVSEKVEKEKLKEHKIALWFISFVTVLFNFVPILNLFGPFFGEISMFHYLKSLEKIETNS